jgi:anaerobic C4-dicarboxylate transporter
MVTTVGRLRFLGVRAAGESIAFLGGVGVTVMLILFALASWSVTRPGIAETIGAVPALQAISFAGGGPDSPSASSG